MIQSARSPLPLGSCTCFLPQQPQPLSAQGNRAAGRTPACLAGDHAARPRTSPPSACKGPGKGRQQGIWGTGLENGLGHRSGLMARIWICTLLQSKATGLMVLRAAQSWCLTYCTAAGSPHTEMEKAAARTPSKAIHVAFSPFPTCLASN